MSDLIQKVEDRIKSICGGTIPVDYKIGQKSVKKSQELKLLLETREHLINNPISSAKVVEFD